MRHSTSSLSTTDQQPQRIEARRVGQAGSPADEHGQPQPSRAKLTFAVIYKQNPSTRSNTNQHQKRPERNAVGVLLRRLLLLRRVPPTGRLAGRGRLLLVARGGKVSARGRREELLGGGLEVVLARGGAQECACQDREVSGSSRGEAEGGRHGGSFFSGAVGGLRNLSGGQGHR